MKETSNATNVDFCAQTETSVPKKNYSRRQTLINIGKTAGAVAGVIAFIETPGLTAWFLESRSGTKEPQNLTIQEWLARNKSLVEQERVLSDKESEKSPAGFSIRQPAKNSAVKYSAIGSGEPDFFLANNEAISLANPTTDSLVDTKFVIEDFVRSDGTEGIVLAFTDEQIDVKVPVGITGINDVIHPFLLERGENPRIESSVVEFLKDSNQWYYHVAKVTDPAQSASTKFAFTQLQKSIIE